MGNPDWYGYRGYLLYKLCLLHNNGRYRHYSLWHQGLKYMTRCRHSHFRHYNYCQRRELNHNLVVAGGIGHHCRKSLNRLGVEEGVEQSNLLRPDKHFVRSCC